MGKMLYAMRHGETLFNQLRRVQGYADSPLTERGFEQCRQAGLMFVGRNLSFDHFYSSTSERARDTLEQIMYAMFGELVPYEAVKGLKEFDRGLFEGQPLYLMPHSQQVTDSYFDPFQGESPQHSFERIHNTLCEIMSRDEHNQVLVVSHGGVLGQLYRRLSGTKEVVPGQRYGMPNCTVFVYEFDERRWDLSFVEVIFPTEV